MNNIVQAMTFKVYDFTLTAGGSFRLPASGGYFRIMTSTGAVDVTVEGVGTLPGLLAGQALKNVNFPALLLRDASGAPNSGTILVASSEFQDNRLNGTVDLSATSLAALESIDLNAATLATLRQPLASTGNFKSSGALAAGTPETIFAPAANTNGAILLSAGFNIIGNATLTRPSILAKASAPASTIDGEVFVSSSYEGVFGTTYVDAGQLNQPQSISAGLGLYYIHEGAGSGGLRFARYRLL